MTKKFILGKCASRQSDPYWVTNVFMRDLETNETGFIGDMSFGNETEAIRAYNSLGHARDNKLLYEDLPDQLQLELRMCCNGDFIPEKRFIVEEFEFQYCNSNGLYFDIVGVE